MRIYTCTPVAFGGGADFFARDSGLLSRGFQMIGCESRAVMPGERKPDDEPDLIRTDYLNLESPEWWRSLKLDGVVLYAWGRPKFRKVATAIREAGIFLVLNQDSCGWISPLVGMRNWLEENWILTGRGSGPGSWLAFLKLALRGASIGLLVTDPLRAAHLKQGNVIACVSPAAAVNFRRLCGIYGGAELSKRVEMIPHPVEKEFHFDGRPENKFRQVVCVGRWQEHLQKRPMLMQAVLQQLVENDPAVLVEVVGTPTPALQSWHRSLRIGLQERICLRGLMDHDSLAKLLRKSQVFYSPSAGESFGIAAGEALCSGCSVVAGRLVSMASFEWFVSERSGRLATKDDVEGHLLAVKHELDEWATGARDPKRIASIWSGRLHADKVAEAVLRCYNGTVNR